MKALLSQCMKYMPVACMKSLMLAHEGCEFVLKLWDTCGKKQKKIEKNLAKGCAMW